MTTKLEIEKRVRDALIRKAEICRQVALSQNVPPLPADPYERAREIFKEIASCVSDEWMEKRRREEEGIKN